MISNRPGIGNGNNVIVNRPGIGGGNNININRPVIGGNNINVNRPGWGIDPGFSRPHWGNYWQNHCVRPHYHGWYHGCWHGHWANNWYVPLAIGATAWSLGAYTASWGYGPTYYNPYYVTSTQVVAPYDYSQPVVINNYIPADDPQGEASAPPEETPESQQSLGEFDEAREAFQAGNYSQALTKVTEALRREGNDPVMHEFRALCLFAMGEYKPAAAALNSLLASAPGMDWTTMSSLYGNADEYQKQLRRLEDHCRADAKDASGRFVLAYHYLVLGHTDQAINMLRRVVELEPKDATAQRMLAGLSPEKAPDPPAPTEDGDAQAPETDLVGTWKAQAGESAIQLTITDQSTFTWKATSPNQSAKEIAGNVVVSGETLSLETDKMGSMVGKVTSGGADKFTFLMQGMLPSDPGLVFERQKE